MKQSDKHKLNKTIGNYCRHFRMECLHLSLKDMAERTGITAPNFSQFENGFNGQQHYIYHYMLATDNEGLRLGFIQSLTKLITNNDRNYTWLDGEYND